jgi:hypothetical protein
LVFHFFLRLRSRTHHFSRFIERFFLSPQRNFPAADIWSCPLFSLVCASNNQGSV